MKPETNPKKLEFNINKPEIDLEKIKFNINLNDDAINDKNNEEAVHPNNDLINDNNRNIEDYGTQYKQIK